jgi:hypothetical protein
MSNLQTKRDPTWVLCERGEEGALQQGHRREAVEEESSGDARVEAVEKLGQLVAHGDDGCEVGVPGGGGDELEGPGVEVEARGGRGCVELWM